MDQNLLCVGYRSGEVRLHVTTNVGEAQPPELVADAQHAVAKGELGELTSLHMTEYMNSHLLITGHGDGRICVRDLLTGISLVALIIGNYPLLDGLGHAHGRAVTHLGAMVDPAEGAVMFVSSGADGRTIVWQICDE